MSYTFSQASAFNQSIGSWQVGALTDATNMFQSVTLSTANYDALLNGWSTQTLKSSVRFSGGNSKYWDDTAARTIMTSVPNSWSITDGGKLYLVSVTINQAAGQTDPTRFSPINFTVQFSTGVTGFTSTDVTLSGTASPTTAVVAAIGAAPKDPRFRTTYNVAVSGMAGSGTVTASIPAGAAQTAAGNLNYASTSTDNTVSYDVTPPSITITAPDSTPALSKTITASVSDGTLTMSNTSESICDGSLTFIPYASQTFTTESDNGTRVCYKAVDALGNTSYSLSSAIAGIDTTAPTVVMSSTLGDPTKTSPIPVTVTFSESVTDFTASDILAVNGTVSNFAGAGAAYTFDLTPSANGLVTANIAAGMATDAAGNGNSAAAQFRRTYDTTAITYLYIYYIPFIDK